MAHRQQRERDPQRNNYHNTQGGQSQKYNNGNGRDNRSNQGRNQQEGPNHGDGWHDSRQNNTRNQPPHNKNEKGQYGKYNHKPRQQRHGNYQQTRQYYQNNEGGYQQNGRQGHRPKGPHQNDQQQGKRGKGVRWEDEEKQSQFQQRKRTEPWDAQQKPRHPDHRQHPTKHQNQPRRNPPNQRQQHHCGPPEIWQYQSGGEADLDTSEAEDEVLEDAPPVQQEPHTRHPQPQPGAPGPKNQTWQAWQQRQQQQQQQQHQHQHHQQQPVYEEWAQNHDQILRESVDSWERIQRIRVEQQRESLYHLYCETERAMRLLGQQDQKKAQHPLAHPPLQVHTFQEQQTSLPEYNLESSLPQSWERPLSSQAPPRSPPPAPHQHTSPPLQPQPTSTTQPTHPTPPPTSQPNLPPVTTHPQKILQLLLHTTALQQALQATFTLITTHETHIALSEHRRPDLAPLSAFFHSLERIITRAASKLDAFWRSAHKADANGGEFRLAGRAAQVEFCGAWEAVVNGYLEVRRLEGVVFGASSYLRPAASGEGWEEYVGALERFGEGVGAFGRRLVG